MQTAIKIETQHTPGWFTDEEVSQQRRDYNATLVDRYECGLPLTNLDRKEARKLIREAKAFEKQRAKLDAGK